MEILQRESNVDSQPESGRYVMLTLDITWDEIKEDIMYDKNTGGFINLRDINNAIKETMKLTIRFTWKTVL